ncbi:MAG: sugar kinase [Rhodobacteraceae bacterium CG17_big_fil_post_rev_8_21_14_2_50_65_11]|nr:MAG: sugar kinase [Rhodobacteraceae bacterium CG17_big_fil_post_rev_8_21_14_2_50_65_11]
MTQVLCVGAAVLDFVFHLDTLPDRAEKYGTETAEVVGGGCAGNAAVAVARLGGHAVLGARLGCDAVGDIILGDLAQEGVDVAHVTRNPGAASSYSSVLIDKRGERQIVNFRGKGLVLETGWFAGLDGLAAVLADTRQVAAARDALALARSRDIPGVLDGEAPIDPALMALASHLAFSMQGLRSFYPQAPVADALADIARRYGAWACVTDGPSGVWFTTPDGVAHVPAFPVETIDTLAAGDIWHGAFTLALAERMGEPQAIRFANAAAALKCTTFGGRKGCPTRGAVLQYLAEN